MRSWRAAVASGDFPLRDPLTRDTDLTSVYARCRREPSRKDPTHVACAPKPVPASLYWDGAESLIFRPMSEMFGLVSHGESVDVNSLDEVPDSAWFTNRITTITPASLARGACRPDQILDPDAFADGSWEIDKGKLEGSTPGFRIVVPGKGKYMIKVESVDDLPERQSAAAVIGANAYWAAGYYAACEQLVWVRPTLFKLLPGLRASANFEAEHPFDQKRLDALLAKSPTRNGKYRMSASAWLPGYAIGSYRTEGTRDDDPNDVVPHEDRRELRGARLLAAWLGRTDTREANSFDTWIADDASRPDSSPGKVIHYQLDESETLGGGWPWAPAELNRRLGMAYLMDWENFGREFVTLGIDVRPWEELAPVAGHELFAYYQLEPFEPEKWKNEFPNPAYHRMTERDGAWMARILARFTPEMIHALAMSGDFTNPEQTVYLEHVMNGRLDRILERYLLRLSPISDVHIEGDRLCGVDLAEWRGLREPLRFAYGAQTDSGAVLTVTREPRGRICATLQHGGGPYMHVAIEDAVARGKLVAHVYDLGARGFALAGVERPNP